MDDEFEGLENLVPDRVPRWLEEAVRKSKGRDLSKFASIEDFYKETQAIKADRFDSAHFRDMKEAAEELVDLINSRFGEDPTWAELIQDEYLGLYKARPKKRNPKEMKPTHRLNFEVIAKAMGLKDWSQLRTYTELDKWGAAMAAVEFGVKLGELFDEMKELIDAQKDLQDQDDKVRDLIERLEELGPDGEQDEADKLIDQLQDQLEDYEEAKGQLEQQIQQNQNEIRNAARQAASDAREDAENVVNALDAFGTDPGALQRMPAEARIELARRIQRNRKLKELAEKVGRFVRLALGEQARKIVHGTDEVHDVVLGNDINRILPSELTYLTNPKLKREFYRKFAEKELLQYELRGTEKVARGAIICMIDSSGSMGGSKEIWAKAVGIALLNIAAKQNRDFYGIIFSSARELMEFEFPKGKGTPNDVLDFAEFSYMGGTDFMSPISRAIDVLEKQYNDEGSQKGDLVMITDGISAVTDEWLERYENAKDELAFRFYSCLIGVHAPLLETLSDQVYNITELARGDDVQEMFGFV